MPLHLHNVLCHMRTLSLFPFLCQSTINPRVEKKLDDIEQRLQASQMSTSLMASRQPPATFTKCTFIREVHIPVGMSMLHPAAQGFAMSNGRRQTARYTYYRDSDDSDVDD